MTGGDAPPRRAAASDSGSDQEPGLPIMVRAVPSARCKLACGGGESDAVAQEGRALRQACERWATGTTGAEAVVSTPCEATSAVLAAAPRVWSWTASSKVDVVPRHKSMCFLPQLKVEGCIHPRASVVDAEGADPVGPSALGKCAAVPTRASYRWNSAVSPAAVPRASNRRH